MNIKEGYFITDAAKTRFKVWLVKNKLSLSRFAKGCGCSRQYLSQILDGKKKITENAIAHFKKGGYELL